MEERKADFAELEKAVTWLVNSHSCVLASAVRKAIEEIERLRAREFRWIPFTEKYPNLEEGSVPRFVLWNDGVVDISGRPRYTNKPPVQITHWAPIPPLPERTQEEKDEELWLKYLREAPTLLLPKGWEKALFQAGLKAARGEK